MSGMEVGVALLSGSWLLYCLDFGFGHLGLFRCHFGSARRVWFKSREAFSLGLLRPVGLLASFTKGVVPAQFASLPEAGEQNGPGKGYLKKKRNSDWVQLR